MNDGQALFTQYRESGSDAVFAELVDRYIDLVYSVALRVVQGDTHRAEDVAQTVFADLAAKARSLPADLMLGGWLHRHTCLVAGHVMRGERRRGIRERQAVEMNSLNADSGLEFSSIAPVMDDAINSLSEPDRTVILLRFFERRDFQAVGAAIGATEDAARMRVNRALEKLEQILKREGIASTAGALSMVLTAGAVHAAPAGLAAAVCATAAGGVAVSAAATTTQVLVMTTLQKSIVAAVLVAVAGAGIYQARQAADLRREVRALQEENAPLAQQVHALEQERAQFSNQVALLTEENAALRARPAEVLKLRGEVGRLQQEKTAMNRSTALSKVTETPEARQFMRDQQKAGMGTLYKEFAKRMQLPDEQTEQLKDVLADNVMDNLDVVTTVLRDNNPPDEVDSLFGSLESQRAAKLRELLGPEEYAQFEEYTRNLGSLLSAEQFSAKFTGDSHERDAKKKQFYELMLQATQAVLAEHGLPADYQTLPILNFKNIAVPAESERSLKILDAIYGRVAQQSGSYLSPGEIEGLAEFRKRAVENSRMALELNRKMMAPLGN